MKIQKMKIPAILGALLLAGTLSAGAQMNSDSLYKEPYRPQYHFSPEKGWIGDPSGFMYYQGKYHMYWWGKVESTDLVHYQWIWSVITIVLSITRLSETVIPASE